jgi:hypothetical protein
MPLFTHSRRIAPRPSFALVALLVVCAVASLAWARPRNLTHAATHHKLLYVALSGGVRVYDIANNHQYLRTIPLPGFNWERGIQASVANKMLYVSYMWRGQRTPNDGWVVAVDLVTEKMVWAKKYPIADAIAITPDGSKMIIGSGEGDPNRNYFYVANAKTGEEILPRIPVHEFTHNGLLNLAGTRAYLSSIEYDYLVVADMATQQVIKKVGPFGAGNPKNIGIRPFVINGSETLAFVNTNNLQGFEVGDITMGQVLHRVEVQGFPYDPATALRNPSHGIGLTSDERELWVAGVEDHVVIFDASVMPPRQIGAVKVKAIPKWISFSIDNKYVYPGTGDVIDRAQHKVVASIAKSKRQIEVDWENGQPVRASDMYARGAVTSTTLPTTTATQSTTTVATPAVTATTAPPVVDAPFRRRALLPIVAN